MVPNPAPYLDHGILGGFVLIMLVGLGLGFRLVTRLIDTLHDNSKDQVGALKSVESAVKESIDKADQRHTETVGALIRYADSATEMRELVRRWVNGATRPHD